MRLIRDYINSAYRAIETMIQSWPEKEAIRKYVNFDISHNKCCIFFSAAKIINTA